MALKAIKANSNITQNEKEPQNKSNQNILRNVKSERNSVLCKQSIKIGVENNVRELIAYLK
jgi:hypothetical protein